MSKWEERTMRSFIWAFGVAALFVFLGQIAKGAETPMLEGCKIVRQNDYWKTSTFTEHPDGKRNYKPISMDSSFKKASARCDKWLNRKKRKEK